MNKKNINAVLAKQVGQWIESIEDESVRDLAKRNTIVTGGAIVSMLLKEEVKDIDIYFRDKKTTKAVAQYYVKQWLALHPNSTHSPYVIDGDDPISKDQAGSSVETAPLYFADPGQIKIIIPSAGAASENGNVLESPHENAVEALAAADSIPAATLDLEGSGSEKEPLKKYRPVYLSSNAITLSDKVQLVIRFYGEPEEIHKNYDFVHCTNYWTEKEGVTLRPEALEAILAKELRYMGSRYPVCSVIRLRKFIARGWTVNAGQILKMLFQISQLDLTNLKVLEDQLVGVDSAYFNHLIEALKSKQESDSSFVVDSGYLCTLIDRIF